LKLAFLLLLNYCFLNFSNIQEYKERNLTTYYTNDRMRWAGHVARMGENGIFVGMPERKRPLGREKRRWVDNIKMDLREIGWDGIDWIDLAEDRAHWRALVNTVMNLRVP
jgi:hypothetical protein